MPAFVVNVQRGGPGLGGIQPSQSDYFQATKGGGHGDYRMIVLAPASVQEMASLMARRTSSIICPMFSSTQTKLFTFSAA